MDSSLTASDGNFICYDPSRTDYAVTEGELNTLKESAQNSWKDFFLFSCPLGISCILNAIATTTKPFTLTLVLFFNYLIGVVGIALSIVFAIMWCKTKRSLDNLITSIKNKPKMRVEYGQTKGSAQLVVLGPSFPEPPNEPNSPG